MRIKTLSEYPGLIGEVLRRHEARELRRFKRRNLHRMAFACLLFSAVAGFGTAYSLVQLVRFLFRL